MRMMYDTVDNVRYDYGEKYFAEYTAREGSVNGLILTRLRVNFLRKNVPESVLHVVDYGCGSGAFLRALMSDTTYRIRGYDVMPDTVRWLADKKIFYHGESLEHCALTMWDSLEHMTLIEHKAIFGQGPLYVIISIPIVKNFDTLTSWRHYKPREHLWYFDRDGLVSYIQSYGYTLIDESDIETRAGREDIGTFAFKRGGV